MADKDHIIHLPHPSLHKPSAEVSEFGDELEQLVENMERATLDWEASREHEVGVALAAVQVNSLHQVIIIRRDTNDPSNKEFDIYINPEVARFDGEPTLELEGCLSVSDIYGYVPRYPKIKVKAQNIHGKTIKLFARGFLARVFQHEIDHTHGVTFADKLGPDADYYRIEDGKMNPLPREESQQLMKEYDVDGEV